MLANNALILNLTVVAIACAVFMIAVQVT